MRGFTLEPPPFALSLSKGRHPPFALSLSKGRHPPFALSVSKGRRGSTGSPRTDYATPPPCTFTPAHPSTLLRMNGCGVCCPQPLHPEPPTRSP